MQIGISTKKYNLINIFFIILTIFVTAVYIFYPLTTKQNYYKIYLGKESPNYFLPTIKGKPNSLLFNIDVNQIIDKNNWIINTLGGDSFQINVDQKRVFINISDNDIKYFNVIVLGNISNQKYLEIKYTEIDEPRIKTNLSSEVFYLPSNYSLDIAKGFVWNPFFSSKNSNIEIYENNYSYITIPLFKKIILVLFIFIFIVTNFRFKKIVIPKIKFKYIFTLITQVLIISFFVLIAPIKSDDGRYYFSSKILKESNYYIDYLYPTSVPLGFTHALINSIIVDENTSILRMKLLPLVIVAVIWVLISSFLKLHINPKLNIFLFLNFVIFSYSFLSTIRPEPIQALLLTILILVGIKKLNENDSNFSIPIFITFFSLSIHQTGIILFLVLFTFTTYKLKQVDLNVFNLKNFIGFILGILILFINTSPNRIIVNLNEFNYFFDNKFPGSYSVFNSFWREDLRVQHLLNTGLASNISQFIVLYYIFLIVFFVIINLKNLEVFYNKIFIVIVFSTLGLLFVPVKWFHYYGVLITPYILMTFLLFTSLNNSRSVINKTKEFIFKLAFSIIFVFILSKPIVLSDAWIPLYINEVFNKIYIFEFFILFLFFFLSKRKLHLIWLSSILMLFFWIFLSPIFSYINSPKLTWMGVLRQDVFFNSKNCGLLDFLPLNKQDALLFNGTWVAEPYLMLYSNCLKDSKIQNNLWTLPHYSLGIIPPYDSQRLILDSNWESFFCYPVKYIEEQDLCLLKISHNY